MKYKNFQIIIFLIICLFVFPKGANAQGMTDLANVLSSIHKFLIGIGVLSSVFLIPYIAVLMASGNPENIKKGQEWFGALLGGLVLLLLSGTIVYLIGTEMLGL